MGFIVKKLILSALLSLSFLSGSVFAEGNNGIMAIPYDQENLLLIVDTNSKKMLLYHVSSSKGLSLREVRSFEKAFELPSQLLGKGLSAKDEKKFFSSQR